MAERRPGAPVRPVLCGAGALCRRVCRRAAQRPGHVHQQRHQGGGLPADAGGRAPAAGLHAGGAGRGGLLTGQVRHPHRAAPAFATGQGQRLDRGAHHRLHHPGCAAGRPAGRAVPVGSAPVGRSARLAHRLQPPGPGGHCGAGGRVRGGRRVQPAHSADRRDRASDAQEPAGPAARFLALQQPPLARPPGPDFTRHHHPVLGRERQPALHRAGLGRGGAGLQHHASVQPGGCGGARHRRGCGGRVHAHAAGPSHARDAAGHRHGSAGDPDELHRQRLGRRALPGAARRPGWLPGGADERAAAAPGPQPHGRGPLDRGAELQRTGLHPGVGCGLQLFHRRRGVGLCGHHGLRCGGGGFHVDHHEMAPAQPAGARG